MNNKPLLLAGSIALWIIALTLVFMAGRMVGNPWNFNDFNGRWGMMDVILMQNERWIWENEWEDKWWTEKWNL
jgi:hypothetical protein